MMATVNVFLAIFVERALKRLACTMTSQALQCFYVD